MRSELAMKMGPRLRGDDNVCEATFANVKGLLTFLSPAEFCILQGFFLKNSLIKKINIGYCI
jgi:hypothetical protein